MFEKDHVISLSGGCKCKSTKPTQSTPVWAQKKEILKSYQVGWRRLESWRVQGFIRTVKLDDAQSGTRLYYIPDLEDVLFALSSGKRPRIKLGKVGRA